VSLEDAQPSFSAFFDDRVRLTFTKLVHVTLAFAVPVRNVGASQSALSHSLCGASIASRCWPAINIYDRPVRWSKAPRRTNAITAAPKSTMPAKVFKSANQQRHLLGGAGGAAHRYSMPAQSGKAFLDGLLVERLSLGAPGLA